ncbi:MAG: hypothetical protein PHZ00_02400 [Candidatus Peribacteraceae bacterium]|nr:hypothetical protein [Candidatus Peribacteraceae bacterium]
MYLTSTRHRVKDYAVWRTAFDDNVHLLTESGITEWWVVQVDGDPTDVAVIVLCPLKDHWDKFVAADTEKRKQTGTDPREQAGLIGDVQWWAGEVMP